MNELPTAEDLPNNGIMDEGFDQDPYHPDQFVLKPRSYYVVYGLSFIFGGLCIDVTMSHRAGWHMPTGQHLGIFLFMNTLCIVGLLIGFPQRLQITRGASYCTLHIGYGWFSFRYVLPLTAIAGLSLDSVVIKHVGRVPQLSLTWKNRWVPIRIGTYLENEIALERAEYVSQQTGIPIVKIAMKPVIRRRDS